MKAEIFDQYAQAVIKKYKVSKKELFGKSQKVCIADARYMLFYLCSKRSIPVMYIQANMDRCGKQITHSTIIHGIKKIEQQVRQDIDMMVIANELMEDECTL